MADASNAASQVSSNGSAPTTEAPDTKAAEAFARTIAIDMPPMQADAPAPAEEPDEEESDGDPEGTAGIVVEGVDCLCRVLGGEGTAVATQWPLSPEEKAELTEALAIVLAKYNVPDLPYQEETRLVVASLAIAVPRWRRYWAERRGVVTDGDPEPRKEAVRQDSVAATPGLPPTDPTRPTPHLAL